jgi:hypothetical protein
MTVVGLAPHAWPTLTRLNQGGDKGRTVRMMSFAPDRRRAISAFWELASHFIWRLVAYSTAWR